MSKRKKAKNKPSLAARMLLFLFSFAVTYALFAVCKFLCLTLPAFFVGDQSIAEVFRAAWLEIRLLPTMPVLLDGMALADLPSLFLNTPAALLFTDLIYIPLVYDSLFFTAIAFTANCRKAALFSITGYLAVGIASTMDATFLMDASSNWQMYLHMLFTLLGIICEIFCRIAFKSEKSV